MGFLSKMFASYSQKELQRIEPIKQAVLDLDEKCQKMSESELKSQTAIFKERLANGETLDDILPEALAVCREAADRVLAKKPFPVQILGAIVLHQGRISEMKTGEGKTLVACLAAYLNALSGKGVHVVTVNDYLAKIQSEEMGKVYRYLGLSIGLIVHEKDNNARREAYNCDITYATNNELGFDYLRDNMCIHKEDKVQREHNYSIVDEVDSILIDEARTPLIISGQGDKSTELYEKADKLAMTMKANKVVELDNKEEHDDVFDGDYIVDEKAKTATLTQRGAKKAEKYFGIENLMDSENMTLLHHVNQAIKAHGIMKLDVDYVVNDGQIVIVDEFTGRLMFGRRYNEGLHQAIEAKEGVKVERESKTLATITFQNFFRLYAKLSGMTGTAMTEEGEFRAIYNLDVIEVPTNRPMVRKDHQDQIYKTEKGKFMSVCEQIKESHEKGQPVLVGTISIEKSEELSKMLKKIGIKHEVLNAKNHAREAEIVAQAGKKGAVTIATNMAGRGTDIMLGGNAENMAKHEMKRLGFEEDTINEAIGYAETSDEVIISARAKFRELEEMFKKQIQAEADEVREAGGLFIIGTERHESRRIDNQLRGRAGRQGDPGESRFYISLEDDLMRLFGGERVKAVMNTLNIDEDMPIESRMLTNTIESSQRKIEGRNFAARKHVLDYDDVMSQQRTTIYAQRSKVLDGEDISKNIQAMRTDNINAVVSMYCSGDVPENWNIEGLREYYMNMYTIQSDLQFDNNDFNELEKEDVSNFLLERSEMLYKDKEKEFGEDLMREVERVSLLRAVDTKWMDHIDAMEELKRGISLRGYAQKNPVVEYRIEGFAMFDEMIESIKEDTLRMIMNVRLKKEEPVPIKREQVMKPIEPNAGKPSEPVKKDPSKKVGRNDPCPCGSGKKYKKCHGANS